MTWAERLRDSPYTIDLDKHSIETVDVEIRELVSAIRRLLFVKRTLFSCAGIGMAGVAPRNTDDAPRGDPHGHDHRNHPYLVVEYKPGHEHERFHERFAQAFRYRWPIEVRSGIATYRIHWDFYMDQDRDSYIAETWARALQVVKQELLRVFTPKCKCHHPGWLFGHDDPYCEYRDG